MKSTSLLSAGLMASLLMTTAIFAATPAMAATRKAPTASARRSSGWGNGWGIHGGNGSSHGGGSNNGGSGRPSNPGNGWGQDGQPNQNQNKPITLSGTVSALSGSSFSLAQGSHSYMVNIGSATIATQSGGTVQSSFIQNGDRVEVRGTMSAGSMNVTASHITDQSLRQERTRGTVTSVNGGSLTLQVRRNTTQTITYASNVIVTKSGQSASTGDLTNGQSVDISGVADRVEHQVLATKINILNWNGTGSGSTSGSDSASVSLSPYTTTLSSGQNDILSVTGSAPSGVSSVRVYINGSLFQTCSVTVQQNSATCAVTLYGSNYSSGQISVYGQVVDNNGGTANSNTLTLNSTGSGTTTTGSGSDTATISLDPSTSTLTPGQSITVTVDGYAPSGIRSLGVYVNGSVAQTCTVSWNQTTYSCSATLNGNSYSNDQTISVYGQLVDANGQTIDSNTSNLVESGNSNNSGSDSASINMSPYLTTLSANQNVTFTVNGYAPNGVSVVDIYVNGSLAQTCTASGWQSSYACSDTIYGNNYAYGQTISVYGEVIDKSGSTANSNTLTLNTNGSGSTGGGNSGADSATISLSPNTTVLTQGQNIQLTASGYAPNGISSVQIFVNGNLGASCTSGGGSTSYSCPGTLYGSNYSNGQSVSVFARVNDVSGGSADSNSVTLSSNNNGSNSGNGNASVSLVISPYTWNLEPGQTTTATVNAWNAGNVNTLNIYANNNLLQTCNVSGNYSSQTSCAANINANNYQNQTLTIYGQAVDQYGNVTNTDTQTLTVE